MTDGIRRKIAKRRIPRFLALAMALALAETLFRPGSGSCFFQSNGVESGAMSFELRPGVIIDPLTGAAYLMSPQRGIEKIDLSSGRLLWSTANAAKPIAAFDDRLIAQADPQAPDFHVLPLVVLDAKNDGSTVSRISIPMPADVMPSVDNGLGTSFAVEARIEQDRLNLWWSSSAQTISGIAHPGPLPERRENGAVLIDLKTYRVTTSPTRQATAAQGASHKPPQATAPDAFQTPAQLVGKFFFCDENRTRTSGA